MRGERLWRFDALELWCCNLPSADSSQRSAARRAAGKRGRALYKKCRVPFLAFPAEARDAASFALREPFNVLWFLDDSIGVLGLSVK